MEIEPIERFVVRVHGVNLAKPISHPERDEMRRVMKDWAIIILHDQKFASDDDLARMGRLFGNLESSAKDVLDQKRRTAPEIGDVSNQDASGSRAVDSRTNLYNLGNQLWHSDSSFKPVPASFSMLSARVVPNHPANTQFADMTAAYEALDEETKTQIAGLVCEHSIRHSRARLGFFELTEKERENFATARQPLVRRHPDTGRQSLFLSSHAGEIEGWPRPRALALLHTLIEHATQPQFVYTHVWRANDLVMWDNRRTMHRAAWYWDKGELREMRRVTLVGSPARSEQCGG